MKSTKKTKPTFVVDLTNAYSAEDVRIAFVEAKVKAGVPINMDELISYVMIGLEFASTLEKQQVKVSTIKDDKLVGKLIKVIKKYGNRKKPWYKRFWGWLTKPFKKNK